MPGPWMLGLWTPDVATVGWCRTRERRIDPVLLAVAGVVLLALHGWAVAGTRTLLGDDVTVRSGCRTARARIDAYGTVVLPTLLAIAGLVPLGWTPQVPVEPPTADGATRRTLLAAAAGLAVPALALLGATVLAAPVEVARVAAALLVLRAVPLPGTDGGAVLGVVLPGGAAVRWRTWTRRLPPLVPAGLVTAVLAVPCVEALLPG